MDYYAATLREPGEKLNIDGLMIKGIHVDESSDFAVMVISSGKTDGRLNESIIGMAEKIVCKNYDKDAVREFEKLFVRSGKRGHIFKRAIPDLTVLIMSGINYYLLNRGSNRIFRVGRLCTEELLEKTDYRDPGGYYFEKGRLSEGSTLVAANPAFFERQLGSDIHRRLCPQMCTCSDVMQENIEYLGRLLLSRGEGRPVTAAALCVR